MEKAEKEKIRERNCVKEAVLRKHQNISYSIDIPKLAARSPYPWESEINLPRITKEFFRCKGSRKNPPQLIRKGEGALAEPVFDCEGSSRHGLPIIHGGEGVYPILIDLLNYIQKKTGKRVVITSGHRCPTHNTYVDASKEARVSKHQIGAEVDFYVQGMEDSPLEIVSHLIQYYQETEEYKNLREYQIFARYEKDDAKVSIAPWMNKEIYIKLHQKDEGRNGDNRHPHPYLSIQVRFDRAAEERVVYEWAKANKGFFRY